jgi:peroxiredoxin
MRLARRLGLAALAVAIGAGVAAGNADLDDLEAEPQPWLGISFDPRSFSSGVPVQSVFEDTAASASGLRPGDELMSIDGEPVTMQTLPIIIGAAGIGGTITLQVLRYEPTGRDDDAGYRIVSTRATLTARPNDRELLRRQLVGKRAAPFTLVASDAPDAASIDDSVLNDKVGVVVWFSPSSCEGCRGVIDRLGTWAEGQSKDVVVVAGTREEPASLAAYLKSNAITVPVGSDADAWRAYTAVGDPYVIAVVVVVDRDGVVRLALPARTADDAAVDAVIATAERLLERRVPRR